MPTKPPPWGAAPFAPLVAPATKEDSPTEQCDPDAPSEEKHALALTQSVATSLAGTETQAHSANQIAKRLARR